MGQFLLTVATLAVLIFALVDIITSDEWRIKHLPKVAWALIVIFLPIIGAVLWFVLGKERVARADNGGFGDPRRAPAVTEASVDIDAAVDAEIEYHEKQAEIRRLEEKLREKRATEE